jgi:hypothetical protein
MWTYLFTFFIVSKVRSNFIFILITYFFHLFFKENEILLQAKLTNKLVITKLNVTVKKAFTRSV